MENRVGDNVPSATKLKSLLKQLEDVVAQLQEFGVVLTRDERKRLLRARRDSEPMQRLVATLAQKKSLNLDGFPLTGMLNDLSLAQAMEPFESTLTLGLQVASDTLLQADTEAWQAFLAYYGVLSSMAQRDAELATALKPVVDFMKVSRRKPEPAATPAPAPADIK